MTTSKRAPAAVLLTTWTLCIAPGMPAAAGQPDLAQWTHVAPVQVDALPAKGLAELPLPPEVFATARSDLADLRLADGAGRTVPYALRVERGKAEQSVSYQPARTFNPVFLPGRQSSVTVDFAGRAKRTHVGVDTPGTNFRRRVRIEAGQDGESWQLLRKTGWLFRVAHEKGIYNKDEVTLPDNDFRYLRVTVFHAPDDPERVEIRQVRARHVRSRRTPPKTVEAEIRSLTVTEKAKLRATEIHADLGYENLPLHEAAMSFEDASFLRRVEVLGRNRETRTVMESVEDAPPRRREVEVPWRRLSGGTIHRFPSSDDEAASESLRVSLDRPCRYLLIRIYNRDDAPLKFTGLKVWWLSHYLAFQPEGSGPYRLYLGNQAARKPQYDLARFIGRLRTEGVTEVALGRASPNPLFVAKEKVVPWSERYKGLLWAVLLVVLLALGVLVVRQVRRARPVT